MISQQPRPQQRPDLTPEEQEQLKGVQEWAQVRKERRIAMGVPAEDEKPKKKRNDEGTDEEAEVGKADKFWSCLTCCSLCSNCFC